MTRLGWYFAFLFASWTIVLAMCSCIERWDAVDPKSQAKTQDYPCGPLWHACVDSTGKSENTCCPNGEACGPTCPADSCCDEREGASRDAGPYTPTVLGKRRRMETP